jgi:hypothetical protein
MLIKTALSQTVEKEHHVFRRSSNNIAYFSSLVTRGSFRLLARMNERPHFQIARRAAVARLRKVPVVLTETGGV